MEISVSDEAVEWILAKGGKAHLTAGPEVSMCCGTVQLEPEAFIGEPKNLTQFTEREIGGIVLYVPQAFISPYPLEIAISRFFGRIKLVVKGWKML